jgi:hypothetical protein
MNPNFFKKYFVILIIILFIGVGIIPLIDGAFSLEKNNSYFDHETFQGRILFSPMNSKKTYLIDKNGEVNHTWQSNYIPGFSVYMLENNTILRTARPTIEGPLGAGGRIQKITNDGTVIWDFSYDTENYLTHHDIEPLPNGNVLMLAWDIRSKYEAISAGKNPFDIPSNEIFCDHIIEVMPTGPTSGEIIWEWDAWDHIIQDYDSTKDNYGVVANHPELIDINFVQNEIDWFHSNSIDYNEEFDQILISVRNFGEIWVIDHSTTTGEAAGHTGGNSGRGGDLLYRWGNPQTYRAGTIADQKLFMQHDAQWIKPDYPGDGNILVFNNGVGRPEGQYSSVDEIVPPVDNEGNYYLESGSKYDPEDPIWIYTAPIPTDFYANYISGAERLINGNTLICDGPAGIFFEVTSEKETVWLYENPYPNPLLNKVFKIQHVSLTDFSDKSDLDFEGIIYWTDVEIGTTVDCVIKVTNIGDPNSFLNWEIDSFPNWGTWSFNPESGQNLMPKDGEVNISISVIAPDGPKETFTGEVKIVNSDDTDDYCIIPVSLVTPVNQQVDIHPLFQRILERFPNMYTFPILKYLLEIS